MRNVYDEIASFYHECAESDPVIDQELIEGYLRKKAWQGYEDGELREIWDVMEWFIQYLVYADIEDLNEIFAEDYIEAILWISETNERFVVNEESVHRFFETIQEFYSYLKNKKMLYKTKSLSSAIDQFFNEGQFIVPSLDREEHIFDDSLVQPESLSEESAQRLNFLLEKLLNKIGIYYKNETFTFDFNRAISLYSGPFNVIPQEDGEEFWLGFWDYFLFDYHLAASDTTPLIYFYEMQKENLTSDEKYILNDLLQAKFMIFYINRIVNPYTVECINLLTDEKIQLPIPDYGMHDYKKVILYGHIYSEGVVMLNYITSVPVSLKFRKRIKEEVLRQQQLYQIQSSNADLDAFFCRHAVTVRHTIDILVSLAKVNVVSPDQITNKFPVISHALPVNPAVVQLVESLVKKYKFSAHSMSLLCRMMKDCFNLADCQETKAEVAAGSVFFTFSMINGVNHIHKKNLVKHLKITEGEMDRYCEKIFNTLQLRIFDPRYLSEEGFILSLYAF